MRKFLRLIKYILPEFLPIPYFYKFKLNYFILPKHHWTQYLQKKYEPETFEKIKKIFNGNQIKSFWDIGANVGMYSVFIAKRYSCEINAFEPTKKYFKILKNNTSSLNNVFPHNYGIASSNNKKSIILTVEPGSNYVSNDILYSKNLVFEDCQLRSINNLSDITAPDFAKIDVEGYEYEILESSIDFFKSNRTILLIEVDEDNLARYSKNKKNVFDLLKSRDYFINKIGISNNYICLLPNRLKNEIQKRIWIEFIGIWGSGKTTAIKKIKNKLNIETQFKTTSEFFKLKKRKRFFYSIVNILKTKNHSLPLLAILLKKLIKGILTKDKILISEIRSFFYCYSARLFSIHQLNKKSFLWEGEFHLIPYIDLNLKQKEFIINKLLNLNEVKSFIFIVLDTSISDAIDMIEKDQLSGKKIRFSPYQFKYFKEYISKSLKHQKDMIDILERKALKIYRIKKLKDYSLKKIYSDISNLFD